MTAWREPVGDRPRRTRAAIGRPGAPALTAAAARPRDDGRRPGTPDDGRATSSWAAPLRRPATRSAARTNLPTRRLVAFFAAPLIVLWIASFLPGGGEAAWIAWGTIVLVAIVGGRSATSAVECVVLAIGAGVGLAWGGLTQTGMPDGPPADEVISTSIVISVVVLIVAAVAFAFGAGGRALRQNASRARGQLGDTLRR